MLEVLLRFIVMALVVATRSCLPFSSPFFFHPRQTTIIQIDFGSWFLCVHPFCSSFPLVCVTPYLERFLYLKEIDCWVLFHWCPVLASKRIIFPTSPGWLCQWVDWIPFPFLWLPSHFLSGGLLGFRSLPLLVMPSFCLAVSTWVPDLDRYLLVKQFILLCPFTICYGDPFQPPFWLTSFLLDHLS